MANESFEKETKPADPLAEVDATGNPEPASPLSPLSPVDPEDEIRRNEESEKQRSEREEIKRTQSYATDASGITRTTTRQSVNANRKPWYKTPNPLRWGPIPPVPTERQVTREYKAGIFSKVTFQWMAPLMNVRASGLPLHG